jgi:hypothetical protein
MELNGTQPDQPRPDLEAEHPGWTIIRRKFADGWSLCAFRGGKASVGRMPDVTRRGEAQLREATTAYQARP